MERLERKKRNGHYYYYYSCWGKVNGKCRRKWQIYLGKLHDIVSAVRDGGFNGAYAEIFERGLPLTLWKEVIGANIIEEIDKQCAKRSQGMTVGEYIATAAINRAMKPVSKRSMWEWFSKTCLVRFIPNASKDSLTSQRFWDHMDRIDDNDVKIIWKNIMKDVIERENIDLSSIQYDGTNFYTYIDTFNTRCDIAQHGKNKQKRKDLRQVNYSLFCSSEEQIPLFFDAYEGNINDYTQFPQVIDKFGEFFKQISKEEIVPEVTMIFDKGNNSTANLTKLDKMHLNFVTSIRYCDAKDLYEIPNNSEKLTPCESEKLNGTRAYRTKRKIMGKTRTVVVTYSQSLYERDLLNINKNMDKALNKLNEYKQNLDDRLTGIITKGKKPTKKTAKIKCDKILYKPHMKDIIKVELMEKKNGFLQMTYSIDEEYLADYLKNTLGKNIIITTRHNWTTDEIIKAYRSQYMIEDVFKEMKNRDTGSWWPMFHWTDSKIKVHGFYCALALLFRALMMRRVRSVGIKVSIKRLLTELNDIREVVNVAPRKGRQKKDRRHTVLTNMSELQQQLVPIFGLEMGNNDRLGYTDAHA